MVKISNVRKRQGLSRGLNTTDSGRKVCLDCDELASDVSAKDRIFRKKLVAGELLNAPGAPRGYRYLDTIHCPTCGHKSVVYRPIKGLWVCTHGSKSSRCDYRSSVYQSRLTRGGISPKVRDRSRKDAELFLAVAGKDVPPARVVRGLAGRSSVKSSGFSSRISRSVSEGYAGVIGTIVNES